MEKGKQRRSILVGCNYPNTKNELHGCIDDVVAMKEVLIERFRFEPSGIELLTDAPRPGSNLVMPAGANIKAALKRMVDGSEAGDVLFFHYNGHGTRIPSMKPRRPFRQDEAIVPTDFNLITDLDFRQLVNRLPKGTSFTILSYSCHRPTVEALLTRKKSRLDLLLSSLKIVIKIASQPQNHSLNA